MCLVTPLHLLHTYRHAVRAARIRPALDQWTRAGQGQRRRAARHRDLRWRHLLQSRRVLVPRARIAYRLCRYDHRPHRTSCTHAPTSCMHTLAGCPHTVAGTSTPSSARRYTRCVPRWAPASRRRCCGHAPITIVRVVGVGGVMTWRLLHPPDCASSLLLLTMSAARHVGLHRARDHRDPRGRLCGRRGRYGRRPRAA